MRIVAVSVELETSVLSLSFPKTSVGDASFEAREKGAVLSFQRQAVAGGELWTLDLESTSEQQVRGVRVKCDHAFQVDDVVFANGYQSWTDSRERPLAEPVPGLPSLLRPLYAKHQLESYGDYKFAPALGKRGVFRGHTYAYVRSKEGNIHFCGSLSERSGYTFIEVNAKRGRVELRKDTNGLVVKERRRVLEVFVANGADDEVFDAWFLHMGVRAPIASSAVGWTSWYYHYTNISQEIISENLKNFAEKKVPLDLFQVDDGWQGSVGDWLVVNSKFPDGMKALADKIRSAGFKPGLWLAPFICEQKSEIFAKHPEWLARDGSGSPLVAGNSDGWSGIFYALNIYHPQVREYLKRVFDTVLKEWGFDLVKLDFLYAAALAPSVHNGRSRCRGEMMCDAMDLLRELVGEKLILGCGVPLGPAFGKVDYCRVGCDVGLSWDDKLPAMVHYRERISTITSIVNAMGRRHLDGRAFWNDPDVFLLREESNSLTPAQRRSLFLANLLFGNLVFTSDDISKYQDDLLGIYLSQFPFAERRIRSVRFLHDVYAWSPRASLLQWAFGEHPYANVALVAFDVRLQNGSWDEHFAAFNLGHKQVAISLPSGAWWNGVSECAVGQQVLLAPFESSCWSRVLAREPVVFKKSKHIFPGFCRGS